MQPVPDNPTVANHDTVRTKRVKEARDEAKQEINDYRAQKEQEFKKFEAEVQFQIVSDRLIEHRAILGRAYANVDPIA